MSFFGLFASSRALRVTDDGVAFVDRALRVHGAQQFRRTWHIAAGSNVHESHRLTRLSLETPGLVVVRLNPALLYDQPDAVARVVASSDAQQHLEHLTLAIKHKSELRLAFLAHSRLAEPPHTEPRGALVVEIELAYASQIEAIKALAGGDVVVAHGAVLARRGDATTVSLIAQDKSRLFLHDDAIDVGPLKNLRAVSLSGGSVVLSSKAALVAHDQLLCIVMGDGRIAVHVPRVETRELVIAMVGESGTAQIHAIAEGIAAGKAETVVLGGGAILVQTSPYLERSAVTNCDHLKLELHGPGCIDVAALATREAHVSTRKRGRAVVQPREYLSMSCEATSTVECVGGLPLRVDPAPHHIPQEMLLVLPHENRVWTAREPVPEAPSVVSAFVTPRMLTPEKAGLRETLRPLWSLVQSHQHPNGPTQPSHAATPAWVNVMGDVSGAEAKPLQ